MRPFLICSMIIFCLGCQKKINLGAHYDKFIGIWIEKDGDASSSYEFKKNYKVIFNQGIDRGFSSKIVSFDKFGIDSETGWERYTIELNNGLIFSLMLSNEGDSLWAGGKYVDDNSIQQQTKQFYTKIQ